MSDEGVPATTEDLNWQSKALMVGAVLSVYFGPLIGWPVALMSGVMAVTAIRRRRWRTALGLTAAVLVGVGSVLTQSLIFRLLYPPLRSRQSEGRLLVKSVWWSQRSFFEDHQRYSENPTEIGFEPEPGNRYSCTLSERLQFVTPSPWLAFEDGGTAYRAKKKSVDDEALLHKALALPLTGGTRVGVSGQCPNCTFTALCVANLDGDETLDIWSISSVERKAPDGSVVAKGDPYCESKDIER